ncbi:putative quinol monooxygenase [Ancylomarina sp. 16SWW S1-10-2]|uniref:putative quinol monooxygenase n=1 Tax=Ancylomarina sp. 16SWW S1-10-2 TaxID=2499681 RepID=UPI0012ADD117|nr:antibiotic biosynthesis monooxygenase [Ancylomarina sp. 16SWW S1-10-2]MRT92865.1 antibiotic biosynthesis monooxygenase [Ancylomarina sp. 16SWW S1-10-2]
MIVRFVKLKLQSQHIADFKKFTEGEKKDIIAFDGCSFLEILQDINNKNLFFSYSHWESEEALNRYRDSAFFKGNWKQVKQWFAAKAEAWSLQR